MRPVAGVGPALSLVCEILVPCQRLGTMLATEEVVRFNHFGFKVSALSCFEFRGSGSDDATHGEETEDVGQKHFGRIYCKYL